VLDTYRITRGAVVIVATAQFCKFIAVMSRTGIIPWVRKLVAKIVELVVA
jgi:hypothetical protein